MGSSYGFNAFVVKKKKKSPGPVIAQTAARPVSLRAPAGPGLTGEGQCPARPQRCVIRGGHWFSGHMTNWTESHLTGEECFGTQLTQTRAPSQALGGMCVGWEKILDNPPCSGHVWFSFSLLTHQNESLWRKNTLVKFHSNGGRAIYLKACKTVLTAELYITNIVQRHW